MTVTGEVTPTCSDIDGVEQGWIGKEYDFTATVSPETALTPITYIWQVDDQIPITHTAGIVDTISFTWDTPGVSIIRVTASNAYGVVMDTHSISLEEIPYTYYLPLMENDAQLSPFMGWVEGVVTDLRTGEPVQASLITVGQPYSTTSDAETGYYQLWLEHGGYTLQASSDGYINRYLTSGDHRCRTWT